MYGFLCKVLEIRDLHIIDHMMQLFDRVTDPNLLVRKITIGANHILNEGDVREEVQIAWIQPGFFFVCQQ